MSSIRQGRPLVVIDHIWYGGHSRPSLRDARERETASTVEEFFKGLDIREGGFSGENLPEHDGVGVHVRFFRRQVAG